MRFRTFAVPLCGILLFAVQDDAISDSHLHLLSDGPASATAQIFKLPKISGFATTERLAINHDKTVIYYSLVNGYEPSSHSKVVYIQFVDGSWSNAKTLVEDYNSPALSADEKTLYIEGKNSKDAWFLAKQGLGWSSPKKLFSQDKERHYLTRSARGNVFYSSPISVNAKLRDVYRLAGADISKTPKAMGLASASEFPRDFYISAKEEYLIAQTHSQIDGSDKQMSIYFRQPDGAWSKPISMGKEINSVPGAWRWGFYVTSDNKYLFITSGDDINNTHIYWFAFEKTLNSLRNQFENEKHHEYTR